MNNKLIWIAVAVIVIIGGIAAYLMYGQAPSTTKADGAVANTNPVSGQQSLKELLAAGQPVKCSFANTADASGASGTTYIATGKMRGDFTTVSSGQTMSGHMVVMDNTTYTWVDGTRTGFKMSLTDTPSQNANSGKPEQVDLDKKMDYNCQPWAVDASLFVLPSDVTFNDISAIIPSRTGAATDTNGDSSAKDCSACDNVPASYKRQCLAAIGCN